MLRRSSRIATVARAVTFATLSTAFGLCSSALAHEDPSSDGLIDGGGNSATDCVSRFQTGLELNYPAPDPFDLTPKPSKELACTDGDLACDADGVVNGSCTFNVGLCLIDDQDTDECVPAGILAGGVVIKNKASSPDPDLAALQSSVDSLLGAGGIPCDNPGAGGGNCMQCTGATTPIVVSIAGDKGRAKIGVKVTTSPAANGKPIKDSDKLKLRCLSCGSSSAFEHIDKIVFQQSCATTSCHGGTGAGQASLNLDSEHTSLDTVYDEVINENPTSPGAVAHPELGLRRVLPSDPDLDGTSSSILIEKLRHKPNELNAMYCAPNGEPDGCMGTEMPPGVDTYSTGKLALLKAWVAGGAPREGWPTGTGCGDPVDIYTPAEPLDPPPAGEGFQMHFVAPSGFFVEPGTEYEGCQWIAMPPEITDTLHITRVQIRMNPGSHHFLAFQDQGPDGGSAVPTAFDPADPACNKKFGVKRQFVGSQDPEFDQTLPTGISQTINPGQVFGLNTHYTNPYNVPIHPEVWVNFWGTTTPTAKEQKSIFPGDFGFSIPPFTEGSGNVVTFTHSGTPGCYFGFSSHSHRRNIGFKIWDTDPSSGGTLSDDDAWDSTAGLFYYNPDWDHPLVVNPSPRMLLNTGDKIYFQCRWDNGFRNPADVTARCRLPSNPDCALLNDHVCFTNADCPTPATTGECIPCPVDFGPLAEDEMCFLPGVYYDAEPSGDPCPY